MTGAMGWNDAALAQLRLEGLEFLNRLQSGSATERDEAEFLAWRGQSPAHEEAFRAAVRLQRLVRCADMPVEPLSWPASVRTVGGPQIARRGLIGGALAASVAGAFAVSRSMDWAPSMGELRADVRTGAGEHRILRLEGGAAIDLNTRTSVALLEGLGAPAVELISGEAIVASGSKPGAKAILVAGKGRSVGEDGRFSARRDGDRVCISCLAGRVEVGWRGQSRRLEAGRQVIYDDRVLGAVTDGVDLRTLTAWQSGTLIFRNLPMRVVVAEINRYRSGKVILANEALADHRLSGTYFVRRLDDFFNQAQMALGVKVTRLPGDVVVLS